MTLATSISASDSCRSYRKVLRTIEDEKQLCSICIDSLLCPHAIVRSQERQAYALVDKIAT